MLSLILHITARIYTYESIMITFLFSIYIPPSEKYGTRDTRSTNMQRLK